MNLSKLWLEHIFKTPASPESHCLVCTLSRVKHFHFMCHSLCLKLLLDEALLWSPAARDLSMLWVSFLPVLFEYQRGMSGLAAERRDGFTRHYLTRSMYKAEPWRIVPVVLSGLWLSLCSCFREAETATWSVAL